MKRRLRASIISLARAVSFGLAVLSASAAWSDWVLLGGAEVAPNIAEFHVQDEGVTVRLEIYVGDLTLFRDLVPREWLSDTSMSVAPDDARLARFAQEGLVLRADGASALPVRAMTIERRLRVDRASPAAGTVDPYSGRTLPTPPDDPRVLFVELFYPFEGAPPKRLEISPPLGPEGEPRATIGMAVFHRAVPVIDFRYLAAPATLHLDWDDPWHSRFDNPNLTRHHAYPRMAFLYAEPYEIRHEALIRVRDAADLVGQPRAGDTLSSEEAQSLAQAAAAALLDRTRLFIEDEPVDRDLDRASFLRIGMRGLELLPPGTPVDVDADILGLIWSTPVDGLPKTARLEWDWFDAAAPEVAAYAIDAAGPFLYPLTPDDPVLVWTNHFKVPPYPEVAEIRIGAPAETGFLRHVLAGLAMIGLSLLALVFVGALRRGPALAGLACLALIAGATVFALGRPAARGSDLDPERLASLTGDLLGNVYRAFDFRLEDQVYDRLALTLDGEILEDVYLDQRDALRIERAGGADARVETLDILSVTRAEGAPQGQVGVRATWNVMGSVGHWGHVHRRANAYEADLTLAPIDGAWKIVGFDVLSQDRLQ